MFVVVGSGPAGIACARRLLERNLDVTMLDAGVSLEKDKEQLLAPLRTQPQEAWSREALALLRSGTQARTSGLQLKLAYGSDYPYQLAERDLGIAREGVACVPSFARGGMSNVWGGSILSYRDEDMTGWPIGSSDLAPHYRAALDWVAHSSVQDRLDDKFPTYSNCAGSIPPSRQAVELLADMETSAGPLQRQGIVFGRSRLAVDPGCIRCGLCMYGCPKHFVFNSATHLADLVSNPRFSYRPGIVVDAVRESGGEVVLETRTLRGGERAEVRAARVFLGCGPLSTTRIMLASLGAFDREVVMRDSQYYIFPMLRYRSTEGFDREPTHSLAQVFVEMFDKAVSPYSVHVQMYSYNDLYLRVFEGMFGPLHRALPLRPLLGRMWIAQGYLHSSESPGIAAVLEKPVGTGRSRMRLRTTGVGDTKAKVRRVVRKLWSLRSELRMAPVAPMLKLGDAGQGYHVGGSFPMRTQPGPFESDTLGRPAGFERLHLVDSTTFPSIPASTVTFTVLANAHRIASAVEVS
jgi:choline dehydrogenase-like flavoprotein